MNEAPLTEKKIYSKLWLTNKKENGMNKQMSRKKQMK